MSAEVALVKTMEFAAITSVLSRVPAEKDSVELCVKV